MYPKLSTKENAYALLSVFAAFLAGFGAFKLVNRFLAIRTCRSRICCDISPDAQRRRRNAQREVPAGHKGRGDY